MDTYVLCVLIDMYSSSIKVAMLILMFMYIVHTYLLTNLFIQLFISLLGGDFVNDFAIISQHK